MIGPNELVIRSTLIVKDDLLDEAYKVGADTLCIDLEDSVPLGLKDVARAKIKDSLSLLLKGGSEVAVRINSLSNKPKDMIVADLEASIWPGMSYVFHTKTELPQQIEELDKLITSLEKQRGISPGTIMIRVALETAKGIFNSRSILTASHRVVAVNVGDEDLTMEIGTDCIPGSENILVAKQYAALAAAEAGIQHLGSMGSAAFFGNIEDVRKNAFKAKLYGLKGATATNPAQVPIFNEVFTPTEQEINYAQRVKDVFESASSDLLEGAFVSLDGRVLAIPAYVKAKRVLKRAGLIAKFEEHKRQALKSLQS